MDHDITIGTLREMLQEMPKASPYERLTLLAASSISEPVQMSHLAKRLGVTPGALTTIVERLIAGKLMRRVPSEEDRRIVMIEATHRGKRVITRSEERASGVTAA